MLQKKAAASAARGVDGCGGDVKNGHQTVSAVGAALVLALAGSGAEAQQGEAVALPEVVISATPIPSGERSGIDLDKVPGDVTVIPGKYFIQQYYPSVTQAIVSHTPAAVALSVDGSDLSPDLFYRGFDASRISGTAAGLAVYENGVRINESFGDSVNLDLIPPIALASSEIYTNNPIFGLNALGGAINFITKNGFTFHGGDVEAIGGSYGRANAFGEFGKQSGDYSFYFAGDLYRDGGYRPFGAQNAQRFLADLGRRTQDSEIHLIGQFGRSVLGVQGVTPQVLIQQQYNSVFTTPQTTNNQAGQAQLLSRFDITPHWSVASNFYIRQFDQRHVDGNDADVADCSEIDGNNAGTLCQQPLVGNQSSNQLQFRTANGGTIPSMGAATDAFPYGTTALTSTHTTSFGTELQATNKDKFFGHDNYFVVGGSIDTGNTSYTSRTLLGQLNAQFQDLLYGFPGGRPRPEHRRQHRRELDLHSFQRDLLRPVRARHLQRHQGPRGNGRRALQRRQHHRRRRVGRRPGTEQRSQLRSHQPGLRRDLLVLPGAQCLRRLFGGQPRADAARERVRRP